MSDSGIRIEDDFAYLTSFLPDGWREMAKVLGSLRRCRKVPDAERLLRVLLIHLAEGCSLRETALRVGQGGIAKLSDVAIMDRLKCSGKWFQWMSGEMMRRWVERHPSVVFGDKWNIRIVDGTRIKEPGPTGSSWCIHYSIGLPSLSCNEFIVRDKHGSGESFINFAVASGDLLIGDRVYGVKPGIFHVLDNAGDVLVRFALGNLPLQTVKGGKFDLFKKLRTLNGRQIGDWVVLIQQENKSAEGRVCGIKKSRQAAEKAQKKAIRDAQKHGAKVRRETLEAACYTFVFTTVKRDELSKTSVLEMYRGRWQIELVFKRLKSIMGLGHLRKTARCATMAWIQGKLFVAFMIEALIRQGETFFPWGYPICEDK